MKTPVELILLTGFLGTGKTTLLNQLLKDLQGGETGVLVNDFGPVAVDGGLVRRSPDGDGLEIYEVKNGSIFCSCKSGDFVLGLRMFARLRPHRLIVEASGLADPRGMQKIISDNHLEADFTITLSVCMVDATGSYKLKQALPVIGEQIRTADILIVNKTDLADADDLQATRVMLEELNPEAERFETTYARVDPAFLVDRRRAARAAGMLEECRLPGEGPQALFLEAGRVSRPRLTEFLDRKRTVLLRLKGWYSFGKDSDHEWWYLSDNAGAIEWTRQGLPPGQAPGLVAICTQTGMDDFAREWRALLDEGEDE